VLFEGIEVVEKEGEERKVKTGKGRGRKWKEMKRKKLG
jgi:hypothetical protein